MSDAVVIALISATGLILSGVLVELVRGRRATNAVAAAVAAPGDAQLGSLVKETRDLVGQQGTRLAVVERLVDDHLRAHAGRNGLR